MIRDILRLWTLTYPHNSNYALTRISNYSNYSNYSNQIDYATLDQRHIQVQGECGKLESYPTLVRQQDILPFPSSYLVLTTFKRNHDKNSYYLKFSAIPLREHVKLLSRHTRWVAGSSLLSAYRFLQVMGPRSWRSWKRPPYLSILIMTAWLHSTVVLDNVQLFVILSRQYQNEN